MSKPAGRDSGGLLTQNQKNALSDDPGDGARRSFTAHGDGGGLPGEQPAEQGQEQIEAFGKRGQGQA